MTSAHIALLSGGEIHITPASPKTIITFADGTTEEYDWGAEVGDQTLIDAGIWNDDLEWVKDPVTITFGTNVKRITGATTLGMSDNLTTVVFLGVTDIVGEKMFDGNNALTSVTFPSSLQYMGANAFQRCYVLQRVVFKGKTLEQVQAMENYPWRIADTSIITVA